MADRTRKTRFMDGFRRTKIVATVGPASSDIEVLRRLVEAGVDVMRLNFSHGDHDEKRAVIANIREVEAEAGRPIAILQDIQGPKIRVGAIREPPLRLEPGDYLDIHGDGREGEPGHISTNYENLVHETDPGESIFLDDGYIELRVTEEYDTTVRCQVVIGGELNPGKGVNLPGANLSVDTLTEKDCEDLRFGIEHGVDYVALSFVRHPGDASKAREVMRRSGRPVPVIAKVEKREAVDRMNSVLRAFDGAMVARGDLGVELRPEKVPTVQKQLIARALELRRPVITATQMLESMTFNRRPTRAEASDVANAVLDGTHAVMLSGETAIGKHPVEVVKAMHRIVVEAEHLIEPGLHLDQDSPSANSAVCQAGVQLAEQVDADAIVAFGRSGRTAQTLSSMNPLRPVIALCESAQLARRLCLWRGVMPVLVGPARREETAAARIEREMENRQILPAGSLIVSVGSAPGSRTSQSNYIRLIRL
jgi:pyruvate kinase